MLPNERKLVNHTLFLARWPDAAELAAVPDWQQAFGWLSSARRRHRRTIHVTLQLIGHRQGQPSLSGAQTNFKNSNMNQAYLQLLGVLLGGGIALGGSLLAHMFAKSRDTKNRQIDGLRDISHELEKRVRLALDVAQHVNLGLRNRMHDEFARDAFQIDGWKEFTLVLQERHWRFPCMAFLPQAMPEFEAIDRNIGALMDVHGQPLVEFLPSQQDLLAGELHELVRSVESKILGRLETLLGS